MIRVQIQPFINHLFYNNLKVCKYQSVAHCTIRLKLQISQREYRKIVSASIILNRMASSDGKGSISTTAYDVEASGSIAGNGNHSRIVPNVLTRRHGYSLRQSPSEQGSTNNSQTQYYDNLTGVALYSVERYFDMNYIQRHFSTNQSECIRRQASLPEQSYLSNMCLFSGDRSSGVGTSSYTRRHSSTGPRRRRDTDNIEHLRKWISTEVNCDRATRNASGLAFKVMGYNVLAQELLTEHAYLYRNHMPGTLLWEKRWKNLLREIKEHDADIICLQEVQESHLERYYSALNKLGYLSLYQKRSGYRNDGCAIYYRKSMFMLVEHIMVDYFQPDIDILDKGNVAIIAKFAPLVSPYTEFVVATTHLLYNPRRQDIRVAQTQVLLAELDRMAYVNKTANGNPVYLPIILTGDFNSQPTSAVHELISTGILHYEFLKHRTLITTENSTSLVNTTGKTLLPSKLRITDKCQHLDLLATRAAGARMSRSQEETVIQLKTNQSKDFHYRIDFAKNESLFSTGQLSHALNLKSISSYIVGNDTEATTFQDSWITVDYIFYSGTDKKNEYAKLKLLEKYSVPTTQQLKYKSIPNLNLGSDHLALVSKFMIYF